jgi:hypothetical protein
MLANFFGLFEELPCATEDGVRLRYHILRRLARFPGFLLYFL